MFWFGLIVGLIVAAGAAFGIWKLWGVKKVKAIIDILKGSGTEKEKIKAIAELLGIPTQLVL